MPYRLKPSKESLKYIYKYCFQVIPTQLRGQGIAIVSVMSMVSQMASPLIVYSAVWSEKAPFLIVAILSLFGAFPGLFLPETADVHLPDSLEEIEEFGR